MANHNYSAWDIQIPEINYKLCDAEANSIHRRKAASLALIAISPPVCYNADYITMTRQTTPPKPQHYTFSGLTPLVAPVPPMLEKAIGYPHNARFVSFYWIPGGDEAYFDDGRAGGTGEWQGFLAYINHPVIMPLLRDYSLGSSDSDAKHHLILDREERKLYVAKVLDAEAFLSQQWPETEPLRLSKEEWEKIMTQAVKNVRKNMRDIHMDDMHRRIEEQYALVEDLQHWLHKFLPN